MSRIRANNFTDKAGTGAPTFPNGVNVTGVSTFGNVVVGGATTDVVINGDLRVTGIITTGTSSITIDAENDQITVGSATTIHSTGYQIGSSNLHSTGLEVQNLNVSGVVTTTTLKVGTGVTISGGIVTATTYYGSGANLTGIDATQIQTGNTSVQTVDTGSDGHVKITTEGTERARIDSSGRLLVGSSSNSANSRAVFQGSSTYPTAEANIFLSRGETATSGVGLGNIKFSDTTGGIFAQIGAEADGTTGTNDYPGRLLFYTMPDGGSGNPTERMRIDSSGRLLVGTTGPSSAGHEKLRVVKDTSSVSSGSLWAMEVLGTTGVYNPSTTYQGVRSLSGDLYGARYPIYGEVTNGGWGDAAGGFFKINDGYTVTHSAIRCEYAHNGDGAYGSSMGARFFGTQTATTGGTRGIDIDHTAVTAGGSNTGVVVNTVAGSSYIRGYIYGHAGVNRFTVKSDGGIENYSSNNVNLCDEREKKNIELLESTWDCLKHWELKKFHYNQDENDAPKRYGVIAQQVASYCPEVINEFVVKPASAPTQDPDGTITSPGEPAITRMGVKEQQMMWMAIKALQEAQTRIETLETANAALEDLQARLDAAGL